MPVFLKATTMLVGLRYFMDAIEAINATSYFEIAHLDLVSYVQPSEPGAVFASEA